MAELSQVVFVPHNEMELRRLVRMLDQLLDEVGNDESHPLASLKEFAGLLSEKYEDDQVPELEESAGVREGPRSLSSFFLFTFAPFPPR